MRSTTTYLHPDVFHKKPQVTQYAPDLPVERYDHRIGLSSSQVHSTVISSDGRLWAATPAGLACYDGVRARVFGRKDGLANHGLRTLAIHPVSGELWIGTDLGIEVLDISQGKPRPLWSSPIGTINALGLQADSILIGSARGLFKETQKNSFARVKALSAADDTIEKIFTHKDGTFWIIGATTGLLHLSENLEKLPMDDSRPFAGKPVSMAQGPNKSMLIGGTHGFCQMNAQGEVMGSRPSPAPIEALYWDRDKLWFSSEHSVRSISSDFGVNENPKTHLRNVVVKHILGDRFDNIWLATSGQALLKISNFRNTFVDDFPIEGGQILSIYSDPDGPLIGGTSGVILPNGAVILNNLEIWDVLRGGSGKIWSATNKGLYCTPNPQLSFQYRSDDCPVIDAPCRALKIFQGQLYIASIRGLARLGPDGAEEILNPDEKSFGYVYSLHMGPHGHLWIATLGQGLFRYDGETVSSVELPETSQNANVYALTHDDSNRLYLAHDNYISRRNEDGSYQNIYESPSSVAAWSLGWMPGGNLVVGSAAGLIIMNDETGQIKHRISGNFEDIPWEFTTSRSLSIKDHKTVLCGLGSGLRTVELRELIPRNEAPEARLAEISCSGSAFDYQDDVLKIEAGKWRLIIDISTEWFLDNSKMQYKLSGFDEDWSSLQAMGPISYTSLPVGKYKLDVILTSPLVGAGPKKKLLNIQIIPAKTQKMAE